MKYIDADRLRAEINRRIKIHQELSEKPEMSDLKLELQMVDGNLQGIISFIDSLQQEQPEVDIEKIIEQTYHDGSVADTDDMDHVDYENIARYFYELGLNARKEESHE